MRAKGVSLWLMPAAPAREPLAALIQDVSGRFRAPRFEPHVTLVPGLLGAVEPILEAMARLAARTPPFQVRLGPLGWRDEYFRCLFAEVERDPELVAFEANARQELGLEPEPGYFPHLSLLYADLDVGRKRALAAQLPARPAGFEVHVVHVYKTHGAVSRWHRLASFGLSRRPVRGRTARPPG